MADLGTLQERLRKLAAVPRSFGHPVAEGERVLCAHDAHASVATEISETQLPRRLTFTNDRSETFVCVANAGRVLSICLAPSKTCDLPRNPGDLDGQDLAAIAQHLHAFVRDIQHLEVRSERIDHPAQSQHDGLSAQPLFELLATVEGSEEDQTSPLVTFTEQCGTLVDALVVMEAGEFLIAQGEQDLVEPLKAQALAEQLSEESWAGAAVEMPNALGCMIYSGHPEQGQSVFCAMQSGALVLASFPYKDIALLVALWQACLRG